MWSAFGGKPIMLKMIFDAGTCEYITTDDKWARMVLHVFKIGIDPTITVLVP